MSYGPILGTASEVRAISMTYNSRVCDIDQSMSKIICWISFVLQVRMTAGNFNEFLTPRFIYYYDNMINIVMGTFEFNLCFVHLIIIIF